MSGAIVSMCLAITACNKPQPRSYDFFMEDRVAREGTLVRCDEAAEASQSDIECAHARRASVVLALREEQNRREELERESERKMEALKRELAERERSAREAELEALRQEREAYEDMWRRRTEAIIGGDPTAPDDNLSLIELPGSLRLDAVTD